MKKKFTKLALILGLSGVLCVNTFAATFTDVNESHWAYAGISYMQDNGYMLKNSSGQFLPNEQVTYFEFSEILAKITGYQDENVVKDMDEAFKQQIRTNYAKQLPIIQQYDNANKYKSWRKSSNEEIAYLLGRGYLEPSDLAKFMIKSADGKEMNNTMTKQDLAVYLVRLIGKENTAKQEYIGTGFVDENLIKAENRPHVAYLKKLGMVSGNGEGKFGANDKVTRALCAAMTTTAIRHKESIEVEPPTTDTTPDKGDTVEGLSGKVYNIVPRNNAENETLILVEIDGKNKFYTATPATQIVDNAGSKLTVSDIKVGSQITFTVSANDYIQKIQLATSSSGGSGNGSGSVTEDKKEVESYKGEVDRIGRYGDLTLYTSKGPVTFDVSSNCDITYDGRAIDLEDIGLGDSVRIKVQDNEIIEIVVAEKAKEEVEETTLEFVKVVNKLNNYYFTVFDGKNQKEMIVDKTAEIYRDGEEIDLEDLRIGDKITFTTKQDKVVEVEAESTENRIKGDVRSILISSMSEVVVATKEGDVTVAITPNTEIYDSNTREDVTIRDLILGMKVDVRMESKEAISFVIDKAPSKVTYKGTIEEISQGARYIDVLVEYDPMTGETMVIKRINVPSETSIVIGREEGHRKQLKEDMEVLITYNYGEELYPESIEVLSR